MQCIFSKLSELTCQGTCKIRTRLKHYGVCGNVRYMEEHVYSTLAKKQ